MVCRVYERDHDMSSFLVNELLDLLLHPREHNSSQIASDVLALLVGLMYSASDSSISQEWQPLAKFAGEVLKSVTEGVLDVVLDTSEHKVSPENQAEDPHQREMSAFKQLSQTAKSDEHDLSGVNSSQPANDINMYQLVLENPRVLPEALEGYFSAQLVQILTHRPNIKLTKVLKTQEAWCSAKANPTLVALLQKVGVCVFNNFRYNVDCSMCCFNNFVCIAVASPRALKLLSKEAVTPVT